MEIGNCDHGLPFGQSPVFRLDVFRDAVIVHPKDRPSYTAKGGWVTHDDCDICIVWFQPGDWSIKAARDAEDGLLSAAESAGASAYTVGLR